MKAIFLFLGLALSLSAETLPPDAAALQAKRDAKVAEINQHYAAALEKLKKKAMAEGNLETAKLLESEIAKATPDPFLTTKDKVVGTQWKNPTNSWVITFRKDGKMEKSWGKLTPDWKVKDDAVLAEGTIFKFADTPSQMIASGGGKDGIWVKVD
jgi:hypothetical protein